ncbi:MAG: O-antigen/teichoic acid export membrane protein [Arenicella sp.]|jgi:O-antigen/teichoic acid export membrane protein
MNKSSFLKQASVAFVIRIIGAGAGFFMSLVIARSLTPSESGLFFLGFAAFSVLATLSTLGLNTAFVRFVGAYSAENNWSIVNGIIIKGLKAVFFVSLIVMVLLFGFSSSIGELIFSKPELTKILSIMAFAIPSYAIYLIIGFAFQGLHKPIVSVFLQNISCQILVIVMLFIALFFELRVNSSTVSIMFTSAAILTSLLALALWFSRKAAKEAPDYSQTSELIDSAKPLWLMMAMAMLVQWAGQLIAGIYAPAEEVAYFSVAQRTAMLTSFVLIAVNLVAAPRFAASAKQGKSSELRATSLFCSRIMIVLATPVLIIMLSFPEFIMGLFGPEYVKAAPLLQILVLGQFINVVTGSVGFLLNMTGHEKDMRNVVFLSGPLALILCGVLVPLYGVTGAAVATSIALASQNLLAVYKVKQRLGFNTLNIFK